MLSIPVCWVFSVLCKTYASLVQNALSSLQITSEHLVKWTVKFKNKNYLQYTDIMTRRLSTKAWNRHLWSLDELQWIGVLQIPLLASLSPWLSFRTWVIIAPYNFLSFVFQPPFFVFALLSIYSNFAVICTFLLLLLMHCEC